MLAVDGGAADKYVASVFAEKERRIIGALGTQGVAQKNAGGGDRRLDERERESKQHFNILTSHS